MINTRSERGKLGTDGQESSEGKLVPGGPACFRPTEGASWGSQGHDTSMSREVKQLPEEPGEDLSSPASSDCNTIKIWLFYWSDFS